MATQITCIVPDGADPDHRIDKVGGPGWSKDEDTVIAEIRGGEEYFVEEGGHRVKVVIGDLYGRKHLKTVADGRGDNNLLSLPRCT